MARSLDDMIRELAGAGNFSHLSILSSTSGFHASFCPCATHGRGHGFHLTDPVKAAVMAIENAPKARKVSRGMVHSPAERSIKPQMKPVEGEQDTGTPVAPQANVPRPSLMGLFTNEDNDD